MRTPIAYGLGWPERITSGVAPLDLVAAARLDFEAPDEARFPCLRLARESVAAGGSAMVTCNAANEVAVAAFLDETIAFGDIPVIVETALGRVASVEPESIAVVEEADRAARQLALELVADMTAQGRALREG
ncbi:MAG: 1-deoxy-D-xylulose-5-phosphate reductoisomerase, partial [Halieaceae bacterium]